MKSFADAYRLLDQATDDMSAPRLGDLISQEIALSPLLNGFNTTGREISRGAGEFAALAKDLGELGRGHAEEVIEQVGESVKANPLLYAGGAALGALALGFLMSRSEKRAVGVSAPLIDEDLTADSDPVTLDQEVEGTLP